MEGGSYSPPLGHAAGLTSLLQTSVDAGAGNAEVQPVIIDDSTSEESESSSDEDEDEEDSSNSGSEDSTSESEESSSELGSSAKVSEPTAPAWVDPLAEFYASFPGIHGGPLEAIMPTIPNADGSIPSLNLSTHPLPDLDEVLQQASLNSPNRDRSTPAIFPALTLGPIGVPFTPHYPPQPGPSSSNSNVDGKTLCDVCGKAFSRSWDLKRHMKLHTNTRAFVCEHPGCTRTFVQRSALTVHTRVHTGERPHVCQFPGCTRAFGDSSALARHRRLHDADPQPFKCPWENGTCEGAFLRKDALIAHMKSHDPNWVAPPDFARNWVSNALPKKPAKRKRGKDDTSSSEEDDEADDEARDLFSIPALVTGVVNRRKGNKRQAQGRQHPNGSSVVAMSQTLANALEQITPHVGTSRAGAARAGGSGAGGGDVDLAMMLVGELSDEDDGLLGVGLRARR